MFVNRFTFGLLLFSSSLIAETETPPNKDKAHTETVHIFASPYNDRFSDVPASLYRLGPEDTRERQMSVNLSDSLAELPGVYTQKTGPGRSNPIIRGFSISQSVIMADGVRLNTPIQRPGPNEYWNTLDPYAYSNLELILGPGSLRYGSDAMGGVVLAGTERLGRGAKDSELSLDGGDFFLRYGSAQESFSENLKLNFTQSDDLAFSVSLTRQDFDDLRMANSKTLSHSGYEEMGGNFRLEYDLDSQSTLFFGYDNYLLDDTNRVHKTIFGESFEGTEVGTDYERITDFHRQSAFTRYEFRDGSGFISEADINFSWQLLEEDYKRVRTDKTTHSKNNFDDNTYGTNISLKTETDVVDFTYGVDYYYDDVRSASSQSTIQGVVADDAKYQQLGLYAIADIPLSGISDQLSLVLGTRYNYTDMDAGKVILAGNPGSIEGDWEAWTSSAHLVYEFNDFTSAYLGVSQGFRAPNLSDTTRNGDFGSGGTEAPTADIDPEYTTTYETGIKVQKAAWALQASVFYTDMKDRIQRVDETKFNVDDSDLYGFELAGTYHFNETWSIFGNISAVETSTENFLNNDSTQPLVDDQFSKVPPLHGQLGLRCDASEKLWTEFFINAADQQDDQSLADLRDTQRQPQDGTPAWSTFNLRGGYQFTPQTKLSVGLMNLTDTNYRIHGSGQNEAGRNVMLQLHYSF